MSKQLYGKLTTDGTEQVYIYAINMAFDPVYKQVKKDLWDRKDTSLGIVTSEKLPSEEVSGKCTDAFEITCTVIGGPNTMNTRQLLNKVEHDISRIYIRRQISVQDEKLI